MWKPILSAVLAAAVLGLPAAAWGANPNVVRIDPKTGKQTVLAGGAPWWNLAGIAIGPTGTVYVSSENGAERSSITSLSAPSFAIKPFKAPVEGETAALVTSGTSLYELTSGYVYRHDTVAPFASESLFEGYYDTLNTLRFGAISGTTLYATTYDAGCDSVEGGNGAPLLAIDLVTPAARAVKAGIGCDEPTGLAAAPDGTLFVAVRTEKGAVQIVKVDPTTGKRTTVSRGRLLRTPQGLAMTASGDLIVADSTSGVLRVSPRDGKQTKIASGPALTGLRAVALDAAGRIYAIAAGPAPVLTASAVSPQRLSSGVIELRLSCRPSCKVGYTFDILGNKLTYYEGYAPDPVPATRTLKIKLDGQARKAIASALRDKARPVAVIKLQAITARTGARGKTITVRVPLTA